ncbi:LemA family protein [Curtobacterium ammoniigenes]|uniref:LemA family protein n=1 Tax=Curtobacterium ammoniigenes TaxID=395387 RepID=UPI00082B44B6|nr:LemA family protein [Curtobacterium ammoniigenes]
MDTGFVAAVVAGVVVAILVVVGIVFWMTYHTVVGLQERVDASWRQIAQALQERAELVPTLVDAVQPFASHESAALRGIDEARQETLTAPDAAAASVAEDHMQRALKTVFTLAEGYPQLQTSQSFLQLQSELASTEDRLQSARRQYNGGVRELNTRIRRFPGTTIARSRGVGEAVFFESNERAAIAEPPRVQF